MNELTVEKTADLAKMQDWMTPTGLNLPDNLTREELFSVGLQLHQIESGSGWWRGDWANSLEKHGDLGKMKDSEGRICGFSYETVKRDAFVARHFQMCRRRHILSYAHHIEAAGQKKNDEKWLDKAEEGGWSSGQLRQEIKEYDREFERNKNRKKLESTPDLGDVKGLFSTIVIDPPWPQGDDVDAVGWGRSLATYDTMPLEDIANLPIGEKAAKDAHIYLWIMDRNLEDGFDLLRKWGFRYKSTITWCKDMGMGSHFRISTEHILFGIRGSLPLKRKDAKNWFEAKRGPKGHSNKPVEFHGMVESWSPGPYLEVFSRVDRKDWTAWGENSETE